MACTDRTLAIVAGIMLAAGCSSAPPTSPGDAGTGAGGGVGGIGGGGGGSGIGGGASGGTNGTACEVGYAGDPCSWGVVPRDPGFTEAPSPWTASNGAVIESDAEDPVDPGRAFFPPDSLCAFGDVRQTFAMPSLERSEPFLARFLLRVRQETPSARSPGFGFAVNGSWTFISEPAGSLLYLTREFCLGEAGYGGDVDLRISQRRHMPSCPDTNASLDVGRAQIVPAAEGQCPDPATVLNGDFENESGWQATSEEGTTAAIEEGVGADGTRGGRLTAPSACKDAALVGKVWVPLPETMPSPAIRFWWKATEGARTDLRLDLATWDTLVGTGQAQTALYCLPPWTAGSVREVNVELERTGPCLEPRDWELVMDDFEVVNEPACGTSEAILDPGFESAPIQLIGQRTRYEPAYVETVRNPMLARTGDGVLEVSVAGGASGGQCASAIYEPWVTPPQPDQNGGPALRYWYRIPENPNTETRVGLAETPGTALDETGDWAEGVLCLDPKRAGRPTGVRFLIFDSNSFPCGDFGPAEAAYFDDLELTTDMACPSE